MKTAFSLLLIALTSAATFAQNSNNCETWACYPQKCSWKNVRVVHVSEHPAGEKMSAGYNMETLPKTDQRRTMADLTAMDLKRIKKAARRAHCCTVVVNDDWTAPAALAGRDLANEARQKDLIHFYFTMPCKYVTAQAAQ